MKRFVIPILKAIAIELLDAKKDEPMFSIKCLKCGCIRELGYRFSKRSGDIEVFNDEDIINADEIIVSIKCNKCGNNLDSSEY
jgi:RNase P subunit RPR2